MTIPDTPPTRAEVRDQLRHMLSSPRFRNAPNPSAFLKLATTRKLAGKNTTGNIVKNEMFKGKFDAKGVVAQPGDVRVAVFNLRKALDIYYAAEGRDDLVVISLPKPPKDQRVKFKEGLAYTPTFAYNLNYFMMAALRMGYVCLERWSYTNLVRALLLFSELLEKDVSPIGPTIGVVETRCQFEYRGWHDDGFDWFSTCRELLVGLPHEAHGYWRYWAPWGAAHVVNEDFDQAIVAFDKALTLDRPRTELYEHYIYLLIATGKVQQGLTLANRYLDEHLDDGFAHALFGMFLVFAKRWEAGCQQLEIALQIDPGNCRAHELLGIASLANGKTTDFLSRLKLLKSLYDTQSYEATVKLYLSRAETLMLTAEAIAELNAELSALVTGTAKP